MTNAKDTLNEYNKVRSEWREKLQPLFDEKDKKRSAIKELFGDNLEEMKKQSKSMRTKLNEQWKEENKDLISKYQELYKQKKLDEETFQKWLEEFRKLDANIDEEQLRDMIMWKSEQKESIENLPKLEKENFKIDSTDWKEIEDPNGVRVKENPEWDVREYLEWDYKWEQLFTNASSIRETKKAGKKLPKSWTVFEDIIEKKYKWNYQDFLEWENIKFSGWRNPDSKEFNNIDREFSLWCEDVSCFYGRRNRWSHDYNNGYYGFFVRCLQD